MHPLVIASLASGFVGFILQVFGAVCDSKYQKEIEAEERTKFDRWYAEKELESRSKSACVVDDASIVDAIIVDE